MKLQTKLAQNRRRVYFNTLQKKVEKVPEFMNWKKSN